MQDLVLLELQTSLEGRYLPHRAIGHGAMASVYLADDLRVPRAVAIKTLRMANQDERATERFQREIHYLEQLHHPNIVPLYDSGNAGGLLYYVTSYVAGQTLHDHLRATPKGQLAVAEAVRIARDIADALDYAHGRNILHRDVKPDNVLLEAEHAVIADFGIARAIQLMGEAVITDTGVAIGTPAYMSPEQLAAERQLDARSDIYALACVLYEMLAGVPPFMGTRGVVDNALKFTSRPEPFARYRSDVSGSIERATLRALASDPVDRFSSAGEFVAQMTLK